MGPILEYGVHIKGDMDIAIWPFNIDRPYWNMDEYWAILEYGLIQIPTLGPDGGWLSNNIRPYWNMDVGYLGPYRESLKAIWI